jgi:type III pantothenate kinase
MNLIIDVGNTLVKLAVFDNESLTFKKSCLKADFLSTLQEFSNTFPKIKDVLVSSVGNFSEGELLEIKNRFKVFVLTYKDPIPFKNKYASPNTLGVDRIALVSAAAVQYPNKNVLVIDAGSCITYDFINSDNEYLGGAISPGVTMRYQSLNTLTEKLPLLEPKTLNVYIGNSTDSSMHIGVLQGIINEIEGFISLYKEKHEELTIILTGGDAHYLLDSLKNDIFASSNFLLEGLNYLLEHNKDTC